MKSFPLLLSVLLALLIALPGQAQIRFGPGPTDEGRRLDHIVAVVDDDVITRQELDQALAEAIARIRANGTDAPPPQVLERQVLERLIMERLQRRAAAARNITVDDPSLNAAVEGIARQNGLTLEGLSQALAAEGIDYARFRDDLRQQLLAQRLRQQIVDRTISVSDQEVDNALGRADLGDGREYRLAQILIAVPDTADPAALEQAQERLREVQRQLDQGAEFQRLAVAVSDGREALEGGELGWLPATRLPPAFARVVPQLRPGEVSDPIRSPLGLHLIKLLDVRGQDLEPVTQHRVRHILIRTDEDTDADEAQARLQRLRERIIGGDDFAELARANSMDEASADDGGDLGWLDLGESDPRFSEQIARLRPGEISPPFETAAGWHIAEVLDRRQQVAADAGRRARVREALLRRKAEEEWELWLRQLRARAYVEIRL
ncbi:MAG: peptidylprolyl isomerase [Candidatus Competibacterales bacterium]|nr:peptidylprolyl isomerase [Candidatus Competibacterales bacterium]